jgi:ubiquinone/menaquinone biosynthesis C-methylase UbiE
VIDSSGTSGQRIAADFDARAPRYNQNRWHREVAGQLVTRCALTPGQRVLDAATGTGFAALAAARVVGPTGLVIGVDISAGMLSEAGRAAEAERLPGLAWHQGDASRLPDDWQARFDVVTCAAGLLYMDVARALAEWRRVLKPGGRVAFSSMATRSPPAGALFRDCAAESGVRLGDPSAPLGSARACRAALLHAGFVAVDVETGTVRVDAGDHALAWESNLRSAGHAAVQGLAAADLDALRQRYLSALERASRHDLAALEAATVLYASGRRPRAD